MIHKSYGSTIVAEFDDAVMHAFQFFEDFENPEVVIRRETCCYNPFIEYIDDEFEDHPILTITFRFLDKLIIRKNWLECIDIVGKDFMNKTPSGYIVAAAILYFVTIAKFWIIYHHLEIAKKEMKDELLRIQTAWAEYLCCFFSDKEELEESVFYPIRFHNTFTINSWNTLFEDDIIEGDDDDDET
jgi:hypothetical protein